MSMRFLCKNCWIAHEQATLLAKCKRCEANTRISRLEPLPSVAAGAFTGSGPLVCRLHPSEPLDVFCCECDKSVPPRAVIGERSIVALLGDTWSGKTSYLWSLSERLRQPNDSGLFIRQALGDSDEQMAKAISDTLTSGRMNPTPATDADVRNYAWELALDERSTNLIAFHDAAGEVWNELSGLSRIQYDRFYRYLDLVGSVIFAVDGMRIAEALDAQERRGVLSPQARVAQAHEVAIVDAVSRRVRARRVRVPAAVAITKADVLWTRPQWHLFHEASAAEAESIGRTARELLMVTGRQSLVSALEQAFEPVSYFAVSAFGQKPTNPMRIEDLRPSRVEEPLLALLGATASRK